MFADEFREISKNTFFYRTPPVAACEISVPKYLVNKASLKSEDVVVLWGPKFLFKIRIAWLCMAIKVNSISRSLDIGTTTKSIQDPFSLEKSSAFLQECDKVSWKSSPIIGKSLTSICCWVVGMVAIECKSLFCRIQMDLHLLSSEGAIQRSSYKKFFWKYAPNLQENTHGKVWFQ